MTPTPGSLNEEYSAVAHARNDARAGDSIDTDYADEISMLERALADGPSAYTPTGRRVMRERLAWLRGLTVPVIAGRAAA